MKFKYLGRTGVQVSELCFGTMSFGGDADEETSEQMYRRCREAGINFFDCANVYAGGRSEELLGKFIATEREEVVITSKVYYPMGSDPNARGASRRNIQLAVEKSLQRLNTDWIDIYFHPPFRRAHPHRRDLAQPGRPGAAGQDPVPGGEQFLGLADHEGAGDLALRATGAL